MSIKPVAETVPKCNGRPSRAEPDERPHSVRREEGGGARQGYRGQVRREAREVRRDPVEEADFDPEEGKERRDRKMVPVTLPLSKIQYINGNEIMIN